LANVVAEAEGSQFQYSLVSVQKATLTSTDLEADELWCVVIDQQVTMPWLWTEITSNRFVAFKDGDVWDALPAEALWGKDLEEVPPGPGAIGCKSFIASGE
jgi:hypothetical protein